MGVLPGWLCRGRGGVNLRVNLGVNLRVSSFWQAWSWDDFGTTIFFLRHLGYPPKNYRVQDAISGNNSRFWYHFRIILIRNHQNTCFRPKVTFKNNNKKKPCQEACKQSSGVGKHPKMVPFSKFGNWQIQNSFNGNQSKINEFHNPKIHDLIVKQTWNSDLELSVHRQIADGFQKH